MLPDPFHPAVVHLPVALALVVPLVAVLGILAIRRAFLPVRAWVVVVLLQALLAGSAYLALETGENEEERVERVVAESRIEEHEDAAKRFLLIGLLTLAVSAVGLLRERSGTIGRGATLVLSLVVLAAALATGRSGGELVYRHGAASAYVDTGQGAPGEHEHEEEHDD
jgi:uncharacterized membrane protein